MNFGCGQSRRRTAPKAGKSDRPVMRIRHVHGPMCHEQLSHRGDLWQRVRVSTVRWRHAIARPSTRAVGVLSLLGALVSSSCDTGPEPPRIRSQPAGVRRDRAPVARARTDGSHSERVAPAVEHDEPPEAPDAAGASAQPWILDDLAEVGPAGPAVATPLGVVLVSRDNELLLARWTPPGKPTGRKPVATPIELVDRAPQDFAPLGRGPATVSRHAYWISKGRLVRRALAGGSLEVLATDARDFTRVAAVDPGADLPAAVGYIARSPSDEQLIARLWAEDRGTVTLTPEGSTAISVALATDGTAVVALSVEGRMGMSPVHARRVDLSGKQIRLADDVVVWVAGPTHPLTEIHAAGSEGAMSGLLPVERDSLRFGLARFPVAPEPPREVPVFWRDYPNGMQPSPVAVTAACGRTLVVYARPINGTPHAPQELHLSTLDARGLGPSLAVAGASAFSDVSLAAIPGGMLLAYVADRRTWARTVRCVG